VYLPACATIRTLNGWAAGQRQQGVRTYVWPSVLPAHLLLHVMTCYSLPRQFDMPAGDSAPRSPGGHGLAREHTSDGDCTPAAAGTLLLCRR